MEANIKNIIITGGNMRNKGAQAMLLITASSIKKAYPEYNLYFSSDDCYESAEMFNITYLNKYVLFNALRILAKQPFEPNLIPEYVFRTYKICQKKNYNHLFKEKEYIEILKHTELIIDVSGFAISSKFMKRISDNLLGVLECAHICNIPTIVMPQSFGPFEYGSKTQVMLKRITKVLGYPKIVFAREESGYDLLTKQLALTNVIRSQDLVLQSADIEYDILLKNANTDLRMPSINSDKNVAIVPNSKVFEEYGDILFNVYKTAMDLLINSGRTVYLISHSSEDKKLCIRMKSDYEKNEKVVLLEKELQCYEFEKLIASFDYVIASRFHSIVLSYRSNVPCIGIGWAEKYEALFHSLKQDEYLVKDIRDGLESYINIMEENCVNEKNVILTNLEIIRSNNIFDMIFDVIDGKE